MHGHFLPWKFTLYSTNIFLFNFSVSDLTFKFLGFSQCSDETQKINNMDVMWCLLISGCKLNIGWPQQQTLCGMLHGVGGVMHENALLPMTKVGAEIWVHYMYRWSNDNSLCLKEFILKQQIFSDGYILHTFWSKMTTIIHVSWGTSNAHREHGCAMWKVSWKPIDMKFANLANIRIPEVRRSIRWRAAMKKIPFIY